MDVVVREGPAVLELFSCKDETLLVWRDALLVLDLGLDVVDGVAGFDLKSDGLAGQSFHDYGKVLVLLFLVGGWVARRKC